MTDQQEPKPDISYYQARPETFKIASNGMVYNLAEKRIERSHLSPGLWPHDQRQAILDRQGKISAEKSRERSIRNIAADTIADIMRNNGKIPKQAGPQNAIGYALADTFIRSLDHDEKLRDAVLAQRFVIGTIEPGLVQDRSSSAPDVRTVTVNITGDVAFQVAQLVQGDPGGVVDGEYSEPNDGDRIEAPADGESSG